MNQEIELLREEETKLRQIHWRIEMTYYISIFTILLLSLGLMIAGYGFGMALWLIMLFSTPIYSASIRAKGWKGRVLQQKRLRAEACTSDSAPVLRLRPFEDQLLTAGPSRTVTRGVMPGSSYLRIIGTAASQIGPCLAIGDLRTPRDSTDFFDGWEFMTFPSSDEKWFEMFSLAADAARAIVLVPGLSKGLMREVETLKNHNLLSRIIVFMPPTIKENRIDKWMSPYISNDQTGPHWEEVRKAWAEAGFNLAPYNPEGALYVADDSLAPRSSVSLENEVTPEILNLAVKTLQQILSSTGTSSRIVVPRLTEMEIQPTPPGCLARAFY